MTTRILALSVTPLVVLTLLLAAAAGAAEAGYAPTHSLLVAQAVSEAGEEDMIDSDTAARIAQEQTGGRVLKVNKLVDAGYAVKVLGEDGMVKTIHLSNEGEILED